MLIVKVKDYVVPTRTIEIMPPPLPLWRMAAANGPFVRLAALNGAAAVILGAYGSHRKYQGKDDRRIFETANRYHFIHTLALLGLPMCRAPYMAAIFFIAGIILFSGTCYYSAFTGRRELNKITPFGGVCLIAGWLCMCI